MFFVEMDDSRDVADLELCASEPTKPVDVLQDRSLPICFEQRCSDEPGVFVYPTWCCVRAELLFNEGSREKTGI